MKFNSIDTLQTSLQRSPVDDMKDFVLQLARSQKLNVGEMLALGAGTLIALNPVQKEALPDALAALVREGIFKKENGHYYLTEAGKFKIY